MPTHYTGTIVEQSLVNLEVLKLFTILEKSQTNGDDPWTLYNVSGDFEALHKLSKNMKETGWYAHFWNEEDLVVVFPDKLFKQKVHDTSTWVSAIEYGLSIGIPKEQLDFLM